jgi:hypothetical protein
MRLRGGFLALRSSSGFVLGMGGEMTFEADVFSNDVRSGECQMVMVEEHTHRIYPCAKKAGIKQNGIWLCAECYDSVNRVDNYDGLIARKDVSDEAPPRS